ncbi:MAG: DUF6492 family protein, partial [Lachnospiraceae bacterium]|nr:DUF6492 family protein [Lachnospiraceae bacterium]
MNTYPCVITSIPVDYERTKIHFNRFFDLLPINEIIFIGPENLRNNISSDIAAGLFNNNKLCFICEDELLPFDSIKKIYEELLSKSSVTNPSSVNWYYQQFLKMAYSAICTTDYYLCWDSDTLPLKKIELFNAAGKPYLDVKAENNSSYFSTIEKLFGYGKIIDKSFISEHMFFNKKLMSELITMIENSSFDGIHFYEKILNAVGSDNLALGFSEFETYGTFIGMNYPS